ncbi:presenilins-associated rhomboid-like protein, mitochondrial isoform X2 [Scophthalmus maximus]|uniref:presenilins-associated rhomboid-like protein, mitochondrial isoform X2 n=1 Tax=Scophthalmus maximus TaxID=52904 RepID=UPI001FA87D9F|nr:presenilins-associated rhomboid-like protein, mitochondrial isoform X2 [Scophthalmus maximus]
MAWRSCSVLLRLTGEAVSRSSARGGRCPHSFQQKRGFRKAAKKPEFKIVEEEPGPPRTEPPAAPVQRRTTTPHWEQQAPPPRTLGRLIRPLVFTVGFTGCSFGSAAIWQYESVKFRVQSFFDDIRADWLQKVKPPKRGDVRKVINQWWNSLSEGQKTVTGIIAANAMVFCCWRVPSLQRSMIKYFTANPASKTLCAPMLLSTFSHFSFFHMAANMYVLWSFSSSAVSMLGREQFLAVYLSAGVVSSFVSYVSKMVSGRFRPSLGAHISFPQHVTFPLQVSFPQHVTFPLQVSFPQHVTFPLHVFSTPLSGAIMTVLAVVCTKMPEAKLAIIFLPMFTFSAANALKAIVAMDTAGLVLGWKVFDHAAHLGGALFGIWYVMFGHDLIWKNREPFVKLWHDLRTRGGGGGGAGGGAM